MTESFAALVPQRWTRGDDRWPPGFEDLGPDQPDSLWLAGGDQLEPYRTIAVVGSRNASVWGKMCARDVGRSLSEQGLCVISGLARGIDAAALAGALKGPVPPVAVLGNGLPGIYPPENLRLAQEMVAAGGALVSEYPQGTPPKGFHFPRRNRLISAWAEAVVVVEATLRSGSLGTAHRAQEMGRSVLTFPGAVGDGRHAGCHALIREGALLIESTEDLLEWISTGRDPGILEAENRRLERLWKVCGWESGSGSEADVDSLIDLQRQTGWSAAFLLQVWWRWQQSRVLRSSTAPEDQGQV